MNRTNKTVIAAAESPSQLMGTLAIMGFAAEDNLRDVARALGQRDLSGLSRVEERNAKQPRLRQEIEEQIVEEMAQPDLGPRARHKLILTSQMALMFERMGARTVEMAGLCEQVIRHPHPSRVTDLRKLIEHAVYITDRAASGLVEETPAMARIAREQKIAADDLHTRINRDLVHLLTTAGDDSIRVDLLLQIACKAHGMIEEAGQLAQDVLSFLDRPEL